MSDKPTTALELIPEPIARLIALESDGEPLDDQDRKSLDTYWDNISAEDMRILTVEEASYETSD